MKVAKCQDLVAKKIKLPKFWGAECRLKENTFQAIAETWLERQKNEWSASNHKRVKSYLERDVFPILGGRDIASIEAPEIIPVIIHVSYIPHP